MCICSQIAKVTEISKPSSNPFCSQETYAVFPLSGIMHFNPEGLTQESFLSL